MCERSSEIRLSRPQREKPQDGADDLLHAEKHHLLNIKQSLETQLKAVQQQLQVNDLFLCVCLSVCSSVSVYLSVCLSVCLTVRMSFYVPRETTFSASNSPSFEQQERLLLFSPSPNSRRRRSSHCISCLSDRFISYLFFLVLFFFFLPFLVACTRLYNPLCPLVRRSVGR